MLRVSLPGGYPSYSTNNFHWYIPSSQNLSYIERSVIGFTYFGRWLPRQGAASFFGHLFGRSTRHDWSGILSLQITRCCRIFSHLPFPSPPSLLPARQASPLTTNSRWSRKNLWIIYVFFREPAVVQRGMQMHLLFYHPFECLMPGRAAEALLPDCSTCLSLAGQRVVRKQGGTRKGKRGEKDRVSGQDTSRKSVMRGRGGNLWRRNCITASPKSAESAIK